MSLLDNVLEKRGIENKEDMTDKEKIECDFLKTKCEAIEKDIEKGNVTIETIREFCETEIKILQKEWIDMNCEGLTDLTVRKKEIIIKARIKNYTEILSVFKKADNFKKSGEQEAKKLLRNKK